MPRPANPDLIIVWKNNIPATIAGKVEHLLWDKVHNRPLYGARAKLLETLLTIWLSHIEADPAEPPRPMPTLAEIRGVANATS